MCVLFCYVVTAIIFSNMTYLFYHAWLQLATNDLYRDFILLDPCDAVAVDSFLKGDKDSKGLNGDYKSGSLNSKSCKSFQSPSRRSGGTAHRSHGKSNLNEPWVDCSFAANEGKIGPEPPAFDIAENNDGHTDHAGLDNSDDDDDDDDNDDPWKPLNPHEAGNLKVKPFKKGCQRFCFCCQFFLNLCCYACKFLLFLILFSLPSSEGFQKAWGMFY